MKEEEVEIIRKRYPNLAILFNMVVTKIPLEERRYFYRTFDGLLKELLATENILKGQKQAIDFLNHSITTLREGMFEALRSPFRHEETSDE